MPNQSLLRVIKRWKRYEPRDKWRDIPLKTRGVYVLYQKSRKGEEYNVTYIGVAGIGNYGGGWGQRAIKESRCEKEELDPLLAF